MSANAITPPATVDVADRKWTALPVLLAGTFMVVLDFFIVNVALPSMQTELHASASAIEWVISGYGLGFASLLITAGRLGDQLGRRRMFTLGLTLFTVSSAACGIAPDPATLIGARVAQGAAAALLSPNVLSIIGVTYAGADRLKALSLYGTVMGLAAALGQLIGGALLEADVAGVGWRAIFLINVPIGIAAIARTKRTVPESHGASAKLDLTGTALITVALLAIVLPLVEGRSHGWPAWTWICLAAAPVTLAAFAAQQRALKRRGGAPLLDPDLFKARTFSAGLITQLAFWCGQASFFLVFALYLQQGRGLSALDSGLVFTVIAAPYLLASMQAPRLTTDHGRLTPAAGAISLALGHTLLALTAHGSVLAITPALLLIGGGMGLVITPLTSTVVAASQPQDAGATSGALATVQQVGNALGVALTGVIFFGDAPRHGVVHATQLSLIELAVLLTGVAALTRLLPRHTSTSD
jgi:EmrB/QacA subfamily drug resistance transporter